jgi:hypothetical protein
MFILYRSTLFTHLTGLSHVEVLRGTEQECEVKAAELAAKGFETTIIAIG